LSIYLPYTFLEPQTQFPCFILEFSFLIQTCFFCLFVCLFVCLLACTCSHPSNCLSSFPTHGILISLTHLSFLDLYPDQNRPSWVILFPPLILKNNSLILKARFKPKLYVYHIKYSFFKDIRMFDRFETNIVQFWPQTSSLKICHFLPLFIFLQYWPIWDYYPFNRTFLHIRTTPQLTLPTTPK
jgi:hypothetical protein